MPTAAEVSIMNRALFECGNEPVPDLSDASLDQSNAAVKLLRVMDDARDVVLERHGWACALEYRVLAPETALRGPDGRAYQNFRYPTVYALPGEALRVWEIAGLLSATGQELTGWAPRWQVGTFETDAGARKIIRARHADTELPVAYVRRCNWASLTAQLREAVALRMAAKGVYSINGDLKRQQVLEQSAEKALLEAIGVDATQEGGQPELMPSIPQRLRAYAESGGAWPGFGPGPWS